MAFLENTTKGELNISLFDKDGVIQSVKFPPMLLKNGETKFTTTPVEVDAGFLDAAKKHAVVKQYFEQGLLRTAQDNQAQSKDNQAKDKADK